MLIFVVVFLATTSPNTEPHVNSQSVFFFRRKQRAPLRFASPVSDLGVAVEFRGLSLPPFFFWLWEGWGCKEREGEVKELHSYEQVQCWAK